MGLVRFGAPPDLVLHLAGAHRLAAFVETGTWAGDTALWASGHFAKVVTIENARALFENARERLRPAANVECLFGDTRIELEGVLGRLHQPAIFWLDSHWSGGPSYGERDQCPLLDELQLLNRSPLDHVILIDDARLFLSPPPRPNLIEHWPSIDAVCRELTAEPHRRYVVVFEDVIVAVPSHAGDDLAGWCQERNTEALKRLEERVSQKDLGLAEIASGLRRLGRGAARRLRRLAHRPSSEG